MPFIEHEPPKPEERCTSAEHNPPSHIVLPDGTHKWQCPACGHVMIFVVSSPTWLANQIREAEECAKEATAKKMFFSAGQFIGRAEAFQELLDEVKAGSGATNVR